jgi:hypothetical protein
MSVDLTEFETPEHPDFQRANGAPMVLNKEGNRVRLSRPSNYAKPLDDESALTNWRIDTACIGVANDRAIQAQYVACKRDDREQLKALREAALRAGRGSEGADIGTALHAMSERWERQDESFNPPEPYASKLQAYSDELARCGLVSEMFEFHTVNLDYGSAGTADRLYKVTRDLVAPNGDLIEAGVLVIGDLKTNKRLDYSLASYAVQMALYAQGELYDVATDQYRPTPPIHQRWGVLVWLPSEDPEPRCEALWVDLEAGNYGAWLAQEVKNWRKNWRSGHFASPHIDVPMTPEDVAAEFPDSELIDTSGPYDEIMIAQLSDWCQFRINTIRDHSDARTLLMRLWPEGLPTPKKGLETSEQVDTLLNLLNKVEAEFSFTFPEGDPRVSTGPRKARKGGK